MTKKQKTSTVNRGLYQSNGQMLLDRVDYSTLKLPSFEQTLELMLTNTAMAQVARRQALTKMLVKWSIERG